MSESRDKKLRKLVQQLDVPNLDENDIKAMALAVIYDVEGDNTWAQKVKLEALRLLKDIITEEKKVTKSRDLNNDDILGILKSESGNTNKKSERN